MNLTSYDTGQTFETENLSGQITINNTPKNLGVYIFVDENGNVIQIKKEDRKKIIIYPEKEMEMDWTVIGVSDDTAMGVSDTMMAFANYFPNQRKKK